jgi:hypothetical protein
MEIKGIVLDKYPFDSNDQQIHSLNVHLTNGDIYRIEEGTDGKLLITPIEK